MPSPGRRNLPIAAPPPPTAGVAGAPARTLRANAKVIELTTVRMSWDHQENHDDARSARAVRYISGSMSRGDDVEDEDEDDDDDDDDDDRRRLGGRRRGGDDDGPDVRGGDDDDVDDDDDDGGGGGGSRRLRWRWATTSAAEAEEAGCWNDSTTHAPSSAAMNDDSAMMSDVKCLRCDIVI